MQILKSTKKVHKPFQADVQVLKPKEGAKIIYLNPDNYKKKVKKKIKPVVKKVVKEDPKLTFQLLVTELREYWNSKHKVPLFPFDIKDFVLLSRFKAVLGFDDTCRLFWFVFKNWDKVRVAIRVDGVPSAGLIWGYRRSLTPMVFERSLSSNEQASIAAAPMKIKPWDIAYIESRKLAGATMVPNPYFDGGELQVLEVGVDITVPLNQKNAKWIPGSFWFRHLVWYYSGKPAHKDPTKFPNAYKKVCKLFTKPMAHVQSVVDYIVKNGDPDKAFA